MKINLDRSAAKVPSADREAVYFKWLVSLLLVAAPLFFLVSGMSLSDISFFAKYSITAGVLYLIGVRTNRGMWITGCLLILLAVVGMLLTGASERNLRGLGIVAIIPLAALLTSIAAARDTMIRFLRGRRVRTGQDAT